MGRYNTNPPFQRIAGQELSATLRPQASPASTDADFYGNTGSAQTLPVHRNEPSAYL